jgi:hypothetical protein
MVLLGSAFVLGAVAGGAGMTLVKKSGRDRSDTNADCVVRQRRVCYWVGELQLTADQQEQLVEVYRVGEVEMEALQHRIRPAVDSIYQTIRPNVDSLRLSIADRVHPILTTPQRERYDSIVNAFSERRRSGRERNSTGPIPRDRTP